MEAEKLLNTHKNQTTYGASKTTLFMPNSNRQPVKSEAPDLLGELLPNQVQVYIWKAKGSSVGHISLRLGLMDKKGNNIHISYFPESELKHAFQKATGWWVKTFEEDLKLEKGRQPEFAILLNQLDINKMKEKFEEIKMLNSKWHLLGSTPFKPKDALNCVSAAVEVLRAGGIENLIGEEIIKSKKDDKDFGIWSYKKTETDITCKKLCGCCSSMFQTLSCILCGIGVPLFIILFFVIRYSQFSNQKLENEILTFIKNMPLSAKIACFVLLAAIAIGMSCKFCTFFKKKENESKWGLMLTPDDMEEISYLTKGIVNIIGQGPYDTLRGLYEHTLVPDGRIIEILEKAKKNEKKSSSKLIEEKDTNEIRLIING